MPPAAEPIHEQVVAAVVAALASIVAGGTYWRTTEKAIADPYFHGGHMDKDLAAAKASYVVSHDQDEDTSDSCRDIAVRIELDVTAYCKFEPASQGPWDASAPKRGIVQARLAGDVKNRLRSDEFLAGVPALQAANVTIPHTHFADESLYESWAVVMLRVIVEGSHGPVGA